MDSIVVFSRRRDTFHQHVHRRVHQRPQHLPDRLGRRGRDLSVEAGRVRVLAGPGSRGHGAAAMAAPPASLPVPIGPGLAADAPACILPLCHG